MHRRGAALTVVSSNRVRPADHRLARHHFEDDDSLQGQKEPSVLLRNMVKLEDVDDPFSVGVLPPTRYIYFTKNASWRLSLQTYVLSVVSTTGVNYLLQASGHEAINNLLEGVHLHVCDSFE